MANKPIKICLDAGHYGKYNEGEVPGYWESEIVWKLTNYEKEAIEKYEGVEVVLTRTNQAVDLDLEKRGAKSQGCDFFESNHTNAAQKGSPASYAIGIYLSDDKATSIDDRSRELTIRMTNKVAEVMGVSPQYGTKFAEGWDRDRNGKLDDEWYGVLQGGKKVGTPSFIMEHSFHTNATICKWLMKDSNLKKLAEAKAEVWASYFGLKKKIPVEYPTNYTAKYIGKYTNTKLRYLRVGAGTTKKAIAKIPKGSTVHCYGRWERSKAGNIWKFVTFTVNGIQYEGYVAPTGWVKG